MSNDKYLDIPDCLRNKKNLEREKRIIEIFEDAGMKIELGSTFSAKGQIAQLLNGAEKLIDECATIAETQKPDTKYQWVQNSLWGNIAKIVASKIRNFNT